MNRTAPEETTLGIENRTFNQVSAEWSSQNCHILLYIRHSKKGISPKHYEIRHP